MRFLHLELLLHLKRFIKKNDLVKFKNNHQIWKQNLIINNIFKDFFQKFVKFFKIQTVFTT